MLVLKAFCKQLKVLKAYVERLNANEARVQKIREIVEKFEREACKAWGFPVTGEKKFRCQPLDFFFLELVFLDLDLGFFFLELLGFLMFLSRISKSF